MAIVVEVQVVRAAAARRTRPIEAAAVAHKVQRTIAAVEITGSRIPNSTAAEFSGSGAEVHTFVGRIPVRGCCPATGYAERLCPNSAATSVGNSSTRRAGIVDALGLVAGLPTGVVSGTAPRVIPVIVGTVILYESSGMLDCKIYCAVGRVR